MRVENFLNKTGEGFCLDKWHSSTLHLGTGMEHGCHHCGPVTIDAKELSDPKNLTNHSHKRNIRNEMLAGKKPTECGYCWKSTQTQDRIIQSSKSYNWRNKKITSDVSIPKYLEVSFSNVCNLACSYCGPSFSSVWQAEIEQYGAYANGHNTIYNKQIPNNQENPYVDAFWKWWPELKDNIEVLRITGGEPLMSKHTYKLLEQSPNIKITINTNLCVDDKLLDKFCNAAKNIKRLDIAVSGESTGARAEYARHGLDYKKFLYNLSVIQNRLPHAQIMIMSVYNSLCVSTFEDFLKDVKYRIPTALLSVSRLETPNFFSHQLIDKDQKLSSLEYVKYNFGGEAYYRLKNIINDEQTFNKTQLFADLKTFTDEFDTRRGTHFNSTFPEIKAPSRSA